MENKALYEKQHRLCSMSKNAVNHLVA